MVNIVRWLFFFFDFFFLFNELGGSLQKTLKSSRCTITGLQPISLRGTAVSLDGPGKQIPDRRIHVVSKTGDQ